MKQPLLVIAWYVILSASWLPVFVVAQPQVLIDEFFDTLVRSVRESEVGCSINLPGKTREGICFGEEADTTADALAGGLNVLISHQLSKIPRVATVSLYTYSVSEDGLMRRRTSLGPLYVESPETIGKGILDLGFNYARYSFSKLRSLGMDDLQFVLAPANLGDPGSVMERGNTFFERELLTVDMALQADADVFAIGGTYGLFDQVDLGFTVPFIRFTSYLNASATLTNNASIPAIYYFNDDPLAPELQRTFEMSSSTVAGLGDVSLKAKYVWNQRMDRWRDALFLELQGPLPFGQNDHPLTSDRWNIRLLYLIDRPGNRVSYFGSAGFDFRRSIQQNMLLQVNGGIDVKLRPSIDLLLEVLGDIDIQIGESSPLAPLSDPLLISFESVSRSNVDDSNSDHSLLASMSIKYATLRVSAFAGVLLPIASEWGIYFSPTPRFGINLNLGEP